MNVTVIQTYAGLFLQFGLLPLLLFGMMEYAIVRKGRSIWPLLVLSGAGSILFLVMAVQPTIEMAASFYEMLFRDYNPENAGFFVLFGVITLMGAFVGTLLGCLLGRKQQSARR